MRRGLVAGPVGGVPLPGQLRSVTAGGTRPLGRFLSGPAGGEPVRTARARELDTWLAGLLDAAGPPDGVALVAVGGLGRRECLPYGDLDLILLHDGRTDIAAVAERIWYPIWDAQLRLDHAVRTVAEAIGLAGRDVKVALGLLDARHVAGDPRLTTRLRQAALADWRSAAPARLPALRELTEARWTRRGDLAFLLEGDVKEARGGLRDVGVLRGIGYAQVADAADPAVREASRRLVDVRHALHHIAGRRLDALRAEMQAPVARLLGLRDRDRLAQRVADDARTVAYACDDAWRAVDRWLTVRRWRGRDRKPARRPLADGVVEQQGEVMLSRAAIHAASTVAPADPVLSLRVAAAAARHRLPIARGTLRLLAEASTGSAAALPDPWPDQARHTFLALLGAGVGLVQTWEACDRYGLVTRWLPEWRRVRSRPQRNPVHQYTVDRHLVQTAAYAAELARQVTRPDLLVLAALLHDIGKGLPGDHSQAGVPLAQRICERIGLSEPDTGLVCRLVRHHLLLPDTATRRDLAEPATIELVADVVRDTTTLDLLYALTRADAAATGPLAWSSWKAGLVNDLVTRVRWLLRTGEVAEAPEPSAALTSLAAGPLPVVRIGNGRVGVAVRVVGGEPESPLAAVSAQSESSGASANARPYPRCERGPGLLAAVAGVLAVHRLEVLSADAANVAGVAVVECVVTPRYGTPPSPQRLEADLRRAITGRFPLADRVAAADRAYRGPKVGPAVVWRDGAARRGSVLELRAADSPGLLYRVAYALYRAGVRVRAARVSTLGTDVVDSFYVDDEVTTQDRRAAIESEVLAAAR